MREGEKRPRRSAILLVLRLVSAGIATIGTAACHTGPGGGGAPDPQEIRLKVLAINDFHGQISSGRRVSGRPAGGAGVLAAYLKAAARGSEGRTLLVHAGDFVGASAPASALLADEPSISLLNLLANEFCSYGARLDPRCNVVGAIGNHELDRGRTELMRLLGGGNRERGPFLERPWRGARYPHVCANVVDAGTGEPILPPFVIQEVAGVPIAVVGAILRDAETMIAADRVAGLRFLDEAEAVNRRIPEIRAAGARAVIVAIHDGGEQEPYAGPTDVHAAPPTGAFVDVVRALDDEVDVVVSGHAHRFMNAVVRNRHGKGILVTQAFSYGTAYADIDLVLDRATGDVAHATASVMTTWADRPPGLTPHAAASDLAARAEAAVAPRVNRLVGVAAAAIPRSEAASGESALGNLVADAERRAMGADFAFVNPGGLRADIPEGNVTFGALFAVQPFGNTLVRMELTGARIRRLLEQQWLGQPAPRILKTSGLSYSWDARRPEGSRVLEVLKGGKPLDPSARYTVAVNSFLAGGGDRFSVLREGTNPSRGPVDVDALAAHVRALPQPFRAAIEGRIARR